MAEPRTYFGTPDGGGFAIEDVSQWIVGDRVDGRVVLVYVYLYGRPLPFELGGTPAEEFLNTMASISIIVAGETGA